MPETIQVLLPLYAESVQRVELQGLKRFSTFPDRMTIHHSQWLPLCYTLYNVCLQGRDQIVEEDIYAAMENKALEAYSELSNSIKPGLDSGVPDPIPLNLRKAIAVYEAAKAMTAYITPEFEEVARVSVCPFNIITGYTLFVEDENKNANAILTRGDMESHMVGGKLRTRCCSFPSD